MKINVLIILILLLFSNCNRRDSSILMRIEKDTIKQNETFVAYLSVEHKKLIYPSFYIVQGIDTSLIYFDTSKDNAIFKAVGTKVGLTEYYGFAEFTNIHNKKMNEYFKITFFVK